VGGDVRDRHVANSGAIVGVAPQVPDRVLLSSIDPRRLSEIEKHARCLVECVQQHNNSPILTRPTPILSRRSLVAHPIRVDSPPERAERCPDDGILIDSEYFRVFEDAEDVGGDR